MIFNSKLIAKIFLIYFLLLGIYWIAIFFNWQRIQAELGGEMIDSFYLLGFIFSATYYGFWIRKTYKVLKRESDESNLINIFFAAIVPSWIFFYIVYC
jgi:hypothetical protein